MGTAVEPAHYLGTADGSNKIYRSRLSRAVSARWRTNATANDIINWLDDSCRWLKAANTVIWVLADSDDR